MNGADGAPVSVVVVAEVSVGCVIIVGRDVRVCVLID